MKKIISYLLSFILFVLMLFIIVFNVLEFSISKEKTISYISNSNYLQKASLNIQNRLNEFIINEDLANNYIKYLNKDLMKKDIIRLINNEEINHNENLFELIKTYTDDKEIINSYTKQVSNIYKNNLFPIYEYKIINNYSFSIDKITLINAIIISIILILFTTLYLINKDFNYHKISLLSLSLLLILGSIFMKIIFHNFGYVNNYYTDYFLSILNINIIIDIVIGLVISIILIIKDKNNFHI